MRRPVWTRRRREAKPSTDPAPGKISRVAAAIVAGGPKALRGRGSVVADEPTREQLPSESSVWAHVWHSDDGDALDIWCALASSSARSLLRIVLGGPSGDDLTPLERNIVRETVERLLAPAGRVWEERSAPQLPADEGWCCRITVADALGAKSTFTLHAPAAVAEQPIRERVDLRTVPVSLVASLPTLVMRVDEIARWRSGDVVALGCPAGGAIDLASGRTRVAAGSLGTVRGRRAIQVAPRSG